MERVRWSVTEARLQAESWNTDSVVRKLHEIDGVQLSDSLVIEQVACLGEETGYAVDFTVWSPVGWMFGISVPEVAQGQRQMTVVIEQDEDAPDRVQLGHHSDGTPCFDDDRICY